MMGDQERCDECVEGEGAFEDKTDAGVALGVEGSSHLAGVEAHEDIVECAATLEMNVLRKVRHRIQTELRHCSIVEHNMKNRPLLIDMMKIPWSNAAALAITKLWTLPLDAAASQSLTT